MLIKTLVTGVVTSAAAAGLVTAAAAGVSSVAASNAPAIVTVVWDTPLPQAPAPDLAAPLTQTLTALASPGSFAGKAPYIQGGVGRFESIAADRAYNNAAREGKFPLTFNVVDIDVNGPVATANVTATAATGGTATQPVTFIAGPSPTGWQVTKQSALSLLSAAG
ncbi:hypothetical protein SAMN04488581_3047 [Mycolicibacterium neoaurum]|uniref:Low molecular weight antigen MTB12 n=1 Tax=Mycolicibacterium neoaurum TaxID=1795 RepID=A0AAV2WJB3_MYCNE|nr:hypothetical protein [Mycolicibacterium neoaurum]QVI25952.1 hypothetical protein MN2019_16670 [Mycolicibacterium neoaurum]TLH61370.1 hypothetical protein C1S81_06160 [Mycolicibacterium neoaurum]CDQ44319.1 low molecular weight antigen MTB12 [Mycolicibacterium neoaurum]SDD92185.1 hypothetical protein SAMN04488581_3047 [Mycolicibacterium neoaurum]